MPGGYGGGRCAPLRRCSGGVLEVIGEAMVQSSAGEAVTSFYEAVMLAKEEVAWERESALCVFSMISSHRRRGLADGQQRVELL